MQSRREFLTSASLVAAAGFVGIQAAHADEWPLETTSVRFSQQIGTCLAPQYMAEELLRAEGFTDIRYIAGVPPARMIGRGEIDFGHSFAPSLIYHHDAGLPVVALAGVHPGCWELYVHAPIRTISDLKGKRVGIPDAIGSADHLFLVIIVQHIGLDPQEDIVWVTPDDDTSPMELFIEGKIDAFLGSAPEPQELRTLGIGRVILNSTADYPWSHYFCCMLAANADYVRNYPVATKSVLRAVLKAADICAAEPERVARRLVESGITERYDYALQSLTELPYRSWREYDPEDSLRFYALRLHEAGMIGSSPNALIAESADWSFLDELKRELKA
ncbi:MAG: ABC-type nitrate/sulfonate/bicarbonate transport system [Microvirga sp.]|nr:ABC-type nitrate/sulfonate/bicarbonate transport system [Microvirga sp.]